MTGKLPITYLVLIIIPFFFSCNGTVKKETNTNARTSALSLHVPDEKYRAVDTMQSVVAWKGSMQIGPNYHRGNVYLSQGELMVENGQLTGGTVEVNMGTIEDEKHGSDNNLIKHLKDPDFFDVKKFPFSTIVISKVEPIDDTHKKITANLTIKNITQPVSFPAEVEIKDGIVKAHGKLVIDRTKWDVRYKSGKFYDLLADQTMSDSIEFDMKVVAKK